MPQKKNDDLELRAGAAVSVETRADDVLKIEGHAAVFETPTDIGGFFTEVIARGAFADAIKADDVRLLIEHEGLPLARTKSGTLKLEEDDIGLRINAELDGSDPDVRRLAPKMTRGDLNQMSFGFTMSGGVQEWNEEDEDNPIRTIKKVGGLLDVSIVTFPAFPTTDVALISRSLVCPDRSLIIAPRLRMRMAMAHRDKG